MLSFNVVFAEESVKEIDDYLGKISTYIAPEGGLVYPSTTDVTEWVLSFMSGNRHKEAA